MSVSKEDYKKYLAPPIRGDRKPLHEILPLEHPLRVLIDPSDICNFRCKFCFQSQMKFEGQMMSRETFERVLIQLKDFSEPINVVHLYGLGEPLVNEDVPYYVERLKACGVAREVAVTSNGSLLTHRMSQRLIEAGLDRLSISLNGICDEHFREFVGVRVDFAKMYEQIQYFYSIRKNCHLHVKINGDYFTEEEKVRFVELFKDCTDSINIDHVVNVWPDLTVSDKEQRMYDYDLENLRKNDTKLPPVCPLMFYELHVHSDGRVSPCAVDYSYKIQNLGNIYDTCLYDIWKGKALQTIRLQSLEGKKSDYGVCNCCEYADCAATVNITPYRGLLYEKYREGKQ